MSSTSERSYLEMDKVTPHEGQECATHKYNKAQEHTVKTQYGTSLGILSTSD